MIEIVQGLTLNNPTMTVNNISYPQQSNEVIVECYFVEQGGTHPHSRTYTFENIGGLDLVYSDVIELMRSNEVLNQLL